MKKMLLTGAFLSLLILPSQASPTFKETVNNIVTGSSVGKLDVDGFKMELIKADEEFCEASFKFEDINNPDLKGSFAIYFNNIDSIDFLESNANYGTFSSATIYGDEKNVVGIQHDGSVDVEWRMAFDILRPMGTNLTELISYEDWLENWTDLSQFCKGNYISK